jgi:GntR family transcriptional repressor for pyruvate dehydrogenase complex
MLKPIEKQRVADEIVEQLRSLILTGQYPPGAKLPPERELSKRLGVNRASLREALKKLEHLGLVRIRQGDGTRVQDFMETAGIELITHLLPLAGSSYPGVMQDVLELRRLVARELAWLAAQRATGDDLERLRGNRLGPDLSGERRSPGAECVLGEFELYVALAAASGNRVMTLLLNTLHTALLSAGALLGELAPSPAQLAQHRHQLAEAVARGDGERARTLVDDYLAGSSARAGARQRSAMATQAHA